MWSQHLLVFAILAQLVSPALADPALNPEVSQATINDTICAPGYTYTVRPSYWQSARIKLAMLKARGETWLDAPITSLTTSSRFASAVLRPIRATCNLSHGMKRRANAESGSTRPV